MENNLIPLEFKNQRIMTTKVMAEQFGTEETNIKTNFNNNRQRFEEGKHYYQLEGEELKAFKGVVTNINDPSIKFASVLTLWTERGAARHAKILETDEAWEVYEKLEETYFRGQALKQQYMLPKTFSEALRLAADLSDKNEELKVELRYKEDVIVGLVDEITLAEKRQVLTRVVRHKGANFQERWRELYRQFDMKYHINTKDRLEKYNEVNKPKLKNRVAYIDSIMNKIPELYEIACKLYENDVKELANDIYSLN